MIPAHRIDWDSIKMDAIAPITPRTTSSKARAAKRANAIAVAGWQIQIIYFTPLSYPSVLSESELRTPTPQISPSNL